ncbi:MAG: hypothetical protein PHX54_09155 [Lentimicrobiaceae bacterium]|nr:hypothetical protein [Lentimicrobiaceae bacterium]
METLKKQQSLSILNLISVLFAIGINYYSQIYKINGNTVSDISQKYNNLFTPAGYAFSIWGLIFLAILVFSGYQLYRTFGLKKPMDFISQTGGWFALINFLNGLWIVAWLNEYTTISVIIMMLMLLSFIKIIVNTNMERWHAPANVIVFAWWPLSIYAGWISVATIANIAAWLTAMNWDGEFLSEFWWTIIMIVAAVIINLMIIYKRNMREFALVGVWALVAIHVRHRYDLQLIAIPAMFGVLLILVYVLYQGYRNRKTNPVVERL